MSSAELLTCFFQQCEKRFRFLELSHGHSYLSGMAEYRNNYKIIVPYRGTHQAEPFIAVTRYEKDGHAVEVVYGHENFTLDVFIYTDPSTRLSLKDLIIAKRSNFQFEVAENWISKPDVIEGTLDFYADTMQANAKSFLPPNAKLVERALTIRGKLLEQAIRAHYEKALEEAKTRAAEAFLRKDYQMVIDLLAPFADALDGASAKKLKRARAILGLI